MAKEMLSFDVQQRRRLTREMAAEVAVIVAGTRTLEVYGDVCVPKAPLVAALATYFEKMGAARGSFVELAYHHNWR